MIDEEKIVKYGPEWVIMEYVIKGEDDKIKSILDKNNIHWGELIEQSINHKVLPMLSYTFTNNDILFSYIPPFINQYFKLSYDMNFIKTQEIKKQVSIIAKKLNENNIQFVCTKGVVLDKELYDNKGFRFLSDADFMTLPKHKEDIRKSLEEIGYKVGTVDWKENKVREMTRQEYLTYQMAQDKIPEHVIEINNNLINYVSVGFASSFLWDDCKYNVDIKSAFEQVIYKCFDDTENKIPVLDNVHHFIYIILHLYKHAWLEFLSRRNNDVNLTKFGDVYRFWNKYKHQLKMELPIYMEKYKIACPILWTLHHTDQIFGTNILGELGYADFKRTNREYINSTNDKKGRVRYWKGTMVDRLVSKNRKELYTKDFSEV